MPTYLPPRLGLSHSEAIAEAYASATAGDPVLLTLEIHHPDFDEPARVVNDFRNLTATLEADAPYNASEAVLFTAVPFRYTKPEQVADGSGAPASIGVEIDNVSGHLAYLMALARESMEPVTVIEREYLPSDTSAPHVLPVTSMTLSNIVVSVESCKASLSFGDLTNRKFPTKVYEPLTQTITVEAGALVSAFDVDISGSTNAGTTSAVGVILSGLNPATVYNITQPSGRTYEAVSLWSDDGQNGGLTWLNEFTVTHAGGNQNLGSVGVRYATSAAARAAFPGGVITGYSSYTFWIYDTNPGDNRRGLSLHIEAA